MIKKIYDGFKKHSKKIATGAILAGLSIIPFNENLEQKINNYNPLKPSVAYAQDYESMFSVEEKDARSRMISDLFNSIWYEHPYAENHLKVIETGIDYGSDFFYPEKLMFKMDYESLGFDNRWRRAINYVFNPALQRITEQTKKEIRNIVNLAKYDWQNLELPRTLYSRGSAELITEEMYKSIYFAELDNFPGPINALPMTIAIYKNLTREYYQDDRPGKSHELKMKLDSIVNTHNYYKKLFDQNPVLDIAMAFCTFLDWEQIGKPDDSYSKRSDKAITYLNSALDKLLNTDSDWWRYINLTYNEQQKTEIVYQALEAINIYVNNALALGSSDPDCDKYRDFAKNVIFPKYIEILKKFPDVVRKYRYAPRAEWGNLNDFYHPYIVELSKVFPDVKEIQNEVKCTNDNDVPTKISQ